MENSATAGFGTVTRGPVTPLLLLSTPSIVKLLLRGRCPPTAGPEPTPTPPLLATPELNRERFNTPLPVVAVGTSVTRRPSKVVCTCAVVVSKAWDAPETSMEVTAPLISRVIGRGTVFFSSTLKPFTVFVLKCGEDAETLYVPMGRLLRRYSPFWLASVGYLTPVSVLTASTVALGTVAPVLSRTVPTMSPLTICASTGLDIFKP